jgi:two-component system, response regulator PdtaR
VIGKILVVENELAVGLDLVMEIEQFGYEVVGLTDRAEDALEIAYLLRPDVALIKIGIPRTLDGIHTARLLRSGFEIPAIFIASNLDRSTFARAEEVFPARYLSKPHRSEELKAGIEFALRYVRRRRTNRRMSESPEISGCASQKLRTIVESSSSSVHAKRCPSM